MRLKLLLQVFSLVFLGLIAPAFAQEAPEEPTLAPAEAPEIQEIMPDTAPEEPVPAPPTRIKVKEPAADSEFPANSMPESDLMSQRQEEAKKQQQQADLYGGIHYTAEIRGLDKLTTRISTLKLRKAVPTQFGTLSIKLRVCRNNDNAYQRGAAALLEVAEIEIVPPSTPQDKATEKRKIIYNGWMFSDSPSLNPFDHAVYDLALISCGN